MITRRSCPEATARETQQSEAFPRKEMASRKKHEFETCVWWLTRTRHGLLLGATKGFMCRQIVVDLKALKRRRMKN
ncbi:hypothetical protein OUZ56_000687 [Daphnia magna]|uniref:Uncharacterized protein n=1 Tax=Daphnia magna TaxID=35525 RepID=A0ABR0A0I8_9CRUS|nr:hypothetical protein OUZ56_000687 [Daphnia magna]